MAKKTPHAIMIALPFQGHITPYVNLALKLASKGFVVTFAHLEFIHHTLSKSQDSSSKPGFISEARDSGLDIRYTTISDRYPVEFDRGEEYWEYMLREFPGLVDEFVGKIIRSDQNLAPFLVTDTFFTWPAVIAMKYKLVNVSFWTEPALVFSLAYHIQLLQENGHFPCKDHIDEEITYIPGVESISTKDLMPFLKESSVATFVHKNVVKAFKEVKKADYILHNTVQELESETLSALDKFQPNYAIGPINFSKTPATNTVGNSLWSETNCSQWLNSKSPGSVLYVSFGSVVQASKQVIEEIAYGILLSEVNFIWVVRTDSDALPGGFRDEIKDRGLIVPWCNQIMVLSNPAVGGFLTHCGWNSTLESMWFGVPLICYPLEYDQLTNRKLLVDDWKVGINLFDGTSVDRKEVAEKIKQLMNGTASKGLNVREKLQNAVETDGSSERNFDQFVKDVKAKICKH